jgi:SNF2 family DNA or RNA helicase
MPIPKRVVEAYLEEDHGSLAWVKDLLPLEVEELLNSINPPHKFTVPTFRQDQKILFILGVAYPETMFMSDLGLGKTSVSLELLSYFYNIGKIRRAYVFTPTNEVAEGWEDEIKKWGFTIPYIRLSETASKQKRAKLKTFGNGLIIGTYAGISAMVSELSEYKDQVGFIVTDKNGKPKRKRQINDRLLLQALTDVDAVVYDQSTNLGHKESLTFQVGNEFAIEAKYRFSLAGRAFGRDPFILWAQLYLTDRGKALGTSIGMFREAFWYRKESPWGTQWKIRKRREKLLGERLLASSIRYSVDECLDLPPRVPIIKECTFPQENWEYYDDIAQELVKARGNYREVKNNFLRMRQASSGFIGFKDDETGEKAQIEFEVNPKLDLLLQCLDEIDPDRKAIIFHEFTWSGSKICQALAQRKLKFGWLWGGTKNWTDIKDSFNNDPEYRFLVLNHKKGAQGLNLQVANYTLFYESPVSALQRYECEGRTRRDGQKHTTFYLDLVMRDTVDEDILSFHQEGKDLYKSLVENPEKVLRKKVTSKR